MNWKRLACFFGLHDWGPEYYGETVLPPEIIYCSCQKCDTVKTRRAGTDKIEYYGPLE